MDAVGLARAWMGALNAGSLRWLNELSLPEIAIEGPRGAERGLEVLENWLGRAGARFETRRTFQRGDIIVLAQRGTWTVQDRGGEPSEADVATLIEAKDGRISRVARFLELDAALASGGLTVADELKVDTARGFARTRMGEHLIASAHRQGRTAQIDGADLGTGTSFFLVDCGPGEGPALHFHPYSETWVVLDGEVLFRVGDQRLTAQSGDVLVASPGTPHAFIAGAGSGRLRMMCIHDAARVENRWLE